MTSDAAGRTPPADTASRARESDARRTGPALEAIYQLTRWLIPTPDRFPRRQKFLLGDASRARRSRDWSGWWRRRSRATARGSSRGAAAHGERGSAVTGHRRLPCTIGRLLHNGRRRREEAMS